MLTVAEGTVYNHSSKTTTKFHDHYEYTAFRSCPPAAHLSEPEKDLECTPAAAGATDTSAKTRRAAAATTTTTTPLACLSSLRVHRDSRSE